MPIDRNPVIHRIYVRLTDRSQRCGDIAATPAQNCLPRRKLANCRVGSGIQGQPTSVNVGDLELSDS
jgi:hypothetical protein